MEGCGSRVTGKRIMRVVGWEVRPVIMADDGDSLEPLQVQLQFVPHRQWPQFTSVGYRESLEQLRRQVEQPDPPEDPPSPS